VSTIFQMAKLSKNQDFSYVRAAHQSGTELKFPSCTAPVTDPNFKADLIRTTTKRHVLHEKVKSRQVERVNRIKARARRKVGQIHTGLQVRSQADAQRKR